MKKTQVLVLLVAFIFTLTGCAQMRDKFIRKPKEEDTSLKRYQAVREYDVHPNMELYTKRYIFWKNWHRELLEVLSDSNTKKTTVAVEQEVSNLMDMKSMLVDEKGDELQKYIDELVEIEATIKKERITGGNEIRIRRRLETLGRQVKMRFSYTKMRGFIRDDFRDE